VANKYITLSAVLADKPSLPVPRPNKPVLNLLDIAALNESQRAQDAAAGGADMEPVQKALEKAILREWKAPLIQAVPPSQRRATLLLSVMRDGSIKDAQLQTPSGSQALDDSIRETAAELSKIPETLPSSFPKERYDLRVNFQIE
jgi:outer membrane biosynthesis protein TonB